jgi:hypothetical protein
MATYGTSVYGAAVYGEESSEDDDSYLSRRPVVSTRTAGAGRHAILGARPVRPAVRTRASGAKGVIKR